MGLGVMIVKRSVKQYLLSVNRHALNLTARTTKALTKHVQKRFVTKRSSVGYAVAVHENTTLGLLTMWFPLTPKACYLQHTEVATHHGETESTRLAKHGN
jgi:hypothetical protein